MFQVITSLLLVSNLIFGGKSQKTAKNRFKSYDSTANFSILKFDFSGSILSAPHDSSRRKPSLSLLHRPLAQPTLRIFGL